MFLIRSDEIIILYYIGESESPRVYTTAPLVTSDAKILIKFLGYAPAPARVCVSVTRVIIRAARTFRVVKITAQLDDDVVQLLYRRRRSREKTILINNCVII